MKKILILKDKIEKTGHEAVLYHFLKRYFSQKAEIIQKTFLEVEMEIAPQKIEILVGGVNIKEFDLVWIRRTGSKFYRFAIALAHCLEFLKIKYFDTAFSQAISGDKLICLIRLATANLPIPKTYVCWQEKLKGKEESLAKKFGFPMVAKLLGGHWGSQVFILKNNQDLKKFMETVRKLKRVVFQKYYPHGKGDYRILVLDYQIGAWEKMFRGGFQYPTPVGELQGKEFYPVNKIPKKMKELAIKAAKRMSMEVAGVDIIEEEKTGKYYFTEVNRTPGFAIDYPGDPELKAVASFLEKSIGL